MEPRSGEAQQRERRTGSCAAAKRTPNDEQRTRNSKPKKLTSFFPSAPRSGERSDEHLTSDVSPLSFQARHALASAATGAVSPLTVSQSHLSPSRGSHGEAKIHVKWSNLHVKNAGLRIKCPDLDVRFCFFYIKIAGLHIKCPDLDVRFCFFYIKIARLHMKCPDLDVKFCFFYIKNARLHIKCPDF
jgi:hypothetical protein